MANKFKGEAELNFTRMVDGEEKDAKFKLTYDANAFCEIEDATGLNLGAMLEAVENPAKLSMKLIRGIIYGGLLRHHPEVTIEDAGDIISDAGMEVIMVAFRGAFGGAMRSKEPGQVGNAKRTGRQRS